MRGFTAGGDAGRYEEMESYHADFYNETQSSWSRKTREDLQPRVDSILSIAA
jgi:hypothetical protein